MMAPEEGDEVLVARKAHKILHISSVEQSRLLDVFAVVLPEVWRAIE